MNSVIALIGRQGVGKSTIGESLSRMGWPHIEASSVVRELYGNLSRDEMPTTNERTKTEPHWLGDAIYEKIEKVPSKLQIVTGIREIEVIKTLQFKHKLRVWVFKLIAEQEVRYERLLGHKCFNWLEFHNHESNEGEIGLNKLMSYDYPTYQTSDKSSPTVIAASIVDYLRIKEDIRVG